VNNSHLRQTQNNLFYIHCEKYLKYYWSNVELKWTALSAVPTVLSAVPTALSAVPTALSDVPTALSVAPTPVSISNRRVTLRLTFFYPNISLVNQWLLLK
jgi:hypothetical protein